MEKVAATVISILIWSLAGAPAIAEHRSRSVLVIEATSQNTTYFIGVNRAFNATINAESADSVYVYVENLAVRDFEGTGYFDSLGSFFREKYRSKQIDVIVAFNSLALSYAMRMRDSIWPNVPVVFTGVDDKFAAELNLPSNVTGLTVRHRLEDMVGTARALVPDLGQIVLVGDRLGTKGYWQYFVEEIPDVRRRFEVIDLTNLPMADVRSRVADLPQEAVIVYLGLFTDGAGISFVPSAALQLIADAANRPIVVDTETFVGVGGTGGPAIVLDRIGQEAARLAWRIINGESISEIPVSDGNFLKPIFDWRELQRFGIPENRLPAGSEIRYRPPTAWEQYRWQIILIAAALAAQTVLIAGLLVEHGRRRTAEMAARDRLAELAHVSRVATIGELTASVAHDLKQPLAAILSNAEAAEMFLNADPPALDEVREILVDIRKDNDSAVEIIAGMRSFLRKQEGVRQPVDINIIVDETVKLLSMEAAERKVVLNYSPTHQLPYVWGERVHLQQVMMNLILNAIESMETVTENARQLVVRTSNGENGVVKIVVSDTGSGIAEEKLAKLFEPFFTTKKEGVGMGLSIARTIVEAHRGRIWAENNADAGATFYVTLPVSRG